MLFRLGQTKVESDAGVEAAQALLPEVRIGMEPDTIISGLSGLIRKPICDAPILVGHPLGDSFPTLVWITLPGLTKELHFDP